MRHVPISPILRKNMMLLATAYATAQRRSLSTVAKRVVGDGKFFMEMQAGRAPAKYDDVVGWFKANWPRGVPFPKLNEPWASRGKRTKIIPVASRPANPQRGSNDGKESKGRSEGSAKGKGRGNRGSAPA